MCRCLYRLAQYPFLGLGDCSGKVERMTVILDLGLLLGCSHLQV